MALAARSMAVPEGRILHAAIALSVLAHALVLAMAPGWNKPVANAPLRLTAFLRLESPPAEVRPAAPSAPTQPATPAALPTAPAQPKPSQKPVAPRPILAAAQTPATFAPSLATPPGEPPAPTAAVAASTPGVSADTPVTPPPKPDSRQISHYGRQVEQALQGQHTYPRLAQVRGWQGSVRLLLSFQSSGKLAHITLADSSGHSILDEAAIQLLRAASLPPPPEPLRLVAFQVPVDVVYRLQ